MGNAVRYAMHGGYGYDSDQHRMYNMYLFTSFEHRDSSWHPKNTIPSRHQR